MLINRAQKPSPKREFDFIIPKVEYGNCGNIEYYLVENKKFPIVNLIISQNYGYATDKDGKRGLYFLASRMLQKGAGKYNSLELNERFQYLGVNIHSYFNENDFSFHVQSLTENFEETFSLFADILYRPHLEEKDFLPEQKNLISMLQHSKKEPGSILFNAINKVFGKSTSIEHSLYGYEEDVKNITIDDIKAYYNDVINKSKITLFFTGDITKGEIENLIKKYLVERKEFLLTKAVLYNKKPLGKNLYFINMPDKPQTVIGTAQKIKHFNELDRFSLEIAVNILGGNFTSRLNSNLREEKGFTYGISAYRRYHLDVGFINISTSVDANNSINAVTEIYNEIDKLCKNITQEELDFTKNNLINTFPLIFTTYHSTNSDLKSNVILGLPLNSWEIYRDEISKRNIDQVIKTIRENFDIQNTSALLVGDMNNFSINQNNFFDKIVELDTDGNEI